MQCSRCVFSLDAQLLLRRKLRICFLFFKGGKPLHRNFSVCKTKGLLFQLLLKYQAVQNTFASEILRTNRHHDGAVCPFCISLIIAHSVHGKAPWL
ncbi:unknown [Firmicutes bacterium CAG:791]|nr:unknown [Firmicutes bacterium CAG:791]